MNYKIYKMDTAYEEIEKQYFNSLAAYQLAINSAALVSITDTKGNIVYANNLFCKVSKFNRKELIGSNHRLINSGFHPSEFFDDLWHTITAGGIWRGEIMNKAKDGSNYWVDTTIVPILDEKGHIFQYLSIRSLITTRKNLELENEKLIKELTQKYNELMQFSYIVSHNLKTPVANIFNLAGLLTEECDNCDNNVKELVQLIAASASSIDEIICDLTQTLLTSNSNQRKIENINMQNIIQSVEDNLRKQILDTGARLQIDIDDEALHFKSVKSYL